MKPLLRLVLFPCLMCLPWSSPAQDRGAQLKGDRHIYKTAGDVELALYIYNPAGHQPSNRTPAIVFFFGGGWKNGNPRQFASHCEYLASRGMVGITADYRVSSRHDVKIEDCIADARSAMRWVRGNAGKLGIDPDRIASGGGSAGGHLGAAVALIDAFDAATDDRSVSALPNAMVLFNPALAIAPDDRLPADYSADIAARLDGRSKGPIEQCSPFTYAGRKQPPCIMFFGTADKLLAGAEAYRKASVKAGNDCLIVTWSGQSHGFFNHGKNDNVFYDLTVAQMDTFLVRQGFLPKAAPPQVIESLPGGLLPSTPDSIQPLPLAPPKKTPKGL